MSLIHLTSWPRPLPAWHWLGECRAHFASLAPPARESLTGRFQGEFVGPKWLRYGAPFLLSLLGMRGWWGKEFGPEGQGANLVRRRKGLRRSVPIVLRKGRSRVDGRQGLQVEYLRECSWQWRLFVDEVRWSDRETLLAMSHLKLPVIRWLTLPFLLHRVALERGERRPAADTPTGHQ